MALYQGWGLDAMKMRRQHGHDFLQARYLPEAVSLACTALLWFARLLSHGLAAGRIAGLIGKREVRL